MCVTRHAQITWNNKSAISLQHVKKEVSDAVDFLHADKHESLLQIDTKIFWWVWSSIPDVPKKSSLQCLYNISKKKLWMEFSIFDVNYRFLMKVARHVQSCCYLFLGCCGQKWAWPFRSWNSEICCISREWIDKMSWFFCMLIQI